MTDIEKRLAETLRRAMPLLSRAHVGHFNERRIALQMARAPRANSSPATTSPTFMLASARLTLLSIGSSALSSGPRARFMESKDRSSSEICAVIRDSNRCCDE